MTAATLSHVREYTMQSHYRLILLIPASLCLFLLGVSCKDDDSDIIVGGGDPTCFVIEFEFTPTGSGGNCTETPFRINKGFEWHCVDESNARCFTDSFIDCGDTGDWLAFPKTTIDCADVIGSFTAGGITYTLFGTMEREFKTTASTTPIATGSYDATDGTNLTAGCFKLYEGALRPAGSKACN